MAAPLGGEVCLVSVKCCPTCGLDKARSDYDRNVTTADGLQGRCRACARTRVLAATDEERTRTRDARRLRLRNIRQSIDDLKAAGACTDCNERHPPCAMEYDHLDPGTKSFGVGWGVKQGLAIGVILAEVVKCDLVCSVCHRVRTWLQREQAARPGGRRNSQRPKYLWALELKEGRPCQDCGRVRHHAAMDWDHRPGEAKVARVSLMVQGGWSKEDILLEMAKCDLVCAICHKLRTHRRRPRTQPYG